MQSAGLRINYDPSSPEILARLKPVTPIELIKKIQVDDINFLEGKVKINITLQSNGTFVSTSNYLYHETKGRFDLQPNTPIEIPSSIGFEDKKGYYLMFIEIDNGAVRNIRNMRLMIENYYLIFTV